MKTQISSCRANDLPLRMVRLMLLAAILVPLPGWAAVGSWTKVSNYPANYGAPGHMLLLSDGTVMVQQSAGNAWYRLSPDAHGHYQAGNWSTLSSMQYAREYYSSDVLPDGRVFVAGGEDPANGLQSTNAEIYNPLTNGWTTTAYAGGVGFSDSASIVLSNGNVLVEPVGWNPLPANVTMIYNPTLDTWEASPPVSHHYQDEATWIKLPDDSILTVDINEFASSNSYNTAERFIPSLNAWVAESNTPVADALAFETGGGFMLPNGRAFFLCGSGHTLFYTPTGNTTPGAWQQGPDMPSFTGTIYYYDSSNNLTNVYYSGLLCTADTPSAMMNNGKILCQLSRPTGHTPVWFYEFDPTAGAFIPAPSPTNSSPASMYWPASNNSDGTSMLDLPDGTILYNDTGDLFIYTPDSSTPIVASGTPAITSVSFNSDGSLHLSGTGFNGISQGASYGDDAQMDSNYPLVRFTDGSGTVTYGRTYNWSSTSVQTGVKVLTTECTAPANILENPGNYSLQVVANGNASSAVNFSSPVWVDFEYTSGFGFYFGSYEFPYNLLAEGISAVPSGGIIALNGGTQPSRSSETMTISKPMTIISINGPSTIGQ